MTLRAVAQEQTVQSIDQRLAKDLLEDLERKFWVWSWTPREDGWEALAWPWKGRTNTAKSKEGSLQMYGCNPIATGDTATLHLKF